ncbi:uncharacterized transmembrane protein DDB_G0289901-like [Capsicum annuum]|uniref:uncharacterized transmembrane protein DDB_G0289901-like n=1 Tax=Capsicum annuum TaxID=4072 RepID=UPI001FB07E35|nr:uncharacterized transmembrane protein DDB_G0289901-like [Capsicum annuum]
MGKEERGVPCSGGDEGGWVPGLGEALDTRGGGWVLGSGSSASWDTRGVWVLEVQVGRSLAPGGGALAEGEWGSWSRMKPGTRGKVLGSGGDWDTGVGVPGSDGAWDSGGGWVPDSSGA